MSNKLVVYYTHSGNTEKIARIIAAQTGADLLEIQPVSAYPCEYNAVVAQAKQEISTNFRPELQPYAEIASNYDTFFIGSPNWWNTIAPPIASFLEQQDFSGKRVAPFCTHGGGGMAGLERDTLALCPGAQNCAGIALYDDGGADAEGKIAAWLEQAGLN